MIAFDDDQTGQLPDDIKALFGVGIVADDITETDITFDIFLLTDFQCGVQRLKISMDITDNCIFHDPHSIIDSSAGNG